MRSALISAMEIVTGISFKKIFLDNGNWWKFFITHPKELFRPAIIINVVKMLLCKTELLGFHTYLCPNCQHSVRVNHSCKSRFCSSCGKKATDQWMETNFEELPQTTWQHITFTMPSVYWEFFWYNRHLMNVVPKMTADIIQFLAKGQGAQVGIYLGIHTFGRDLKHNYHIHLSTTCAGLSLDNKRWIKGLYFKDRPIKKMWRYQITNLLREEYKAGQLRLPTSLKHIKNYKDFNNFLDLQYQKKWNVHLQKQSNDHKKNIDYIGRYLKRPPLGETKIKSYDGKNVVYEYIDHYTETTEIMNLSVMKFIARLITHIPDKYFRSIRYYGFLSTRKKTSLLPIVKDFLQQIKQTVQKITFRSLLMKTFGVDPSVCPRCESKMMFILSRFHLKIDFEKIHKLVALQKI